MALEVLVKEISKKGEEEIKRIRAEAEKEAEQIIAEAKEKAEDILKKAKEEAEKEAERLRRQEISGVNLEMKRLMLNKRKDALESVFGMVKDRIKQMDSEMKKKLLENLIKKNAVDGMIVYSNKDYEPVVREIISGMELKYGGNIDCLSGMILESPDGEVRINLTFDELLKQLYEQKMSEVSKILFGE